MFHHLLQFDVGMGSAGGVIAIILANIVAIFLMRMIGKNLGRLREISMARSISKKSKIINTAIAGFIGFLMFFPILWIVVLSFKTEENAIRASFGNFV